MSGPGLQIAQGAASDAGRVRTVNEDAHLLRPDVGLWAVADGMGGHANGGWASSTVVEALGRAELGGDFDAGVQAISEALHAANATIVAAARRDRRTMGSTVAALYLCGVRFAAFWVGDSRIYVRRQGRLHRLTRDHSQVQSLLDAGLLSAAEAGRHPFGHVLTRAVGVHSQLELEGVSDEARPGDRFLLCSDGLTGLLGDEEIGERLDDGDPAGVSAALVRLCLQKGAPDNVTVAVIACAEPVGGGSLSGAAQARSSAIRSSAEE